MIYVVSGFPRSGTSMMMSALEAGGLSVVRSPKRDRLNKRHSDERYAPNPHGLYEPNLREMALPGWPKKHDEQALKVLCPWVKHLSVHRYKVVFLHRDPEEIRQSFEAAFQGKLDTSKIAAQVRDGREQLANRLDVSSLTDMEYADVIENPQAAFDRLYMHGWPIDVEKAAAVVDPSLYRFRRENLTVGI